MDKQLQLFKKRRTAVYFTQEVNPDLTKPPLNSNGRIAKPGWTFFDKIDH